MQISEIRLVKMLEEAESIGRDLEHFRLTPESTDEGFEAWKDLAWLMSSITLKLDAFLKSAPRKCGSFELQDAFEELENSSRSVSGSIETEIEKPLLTNDPKISKDSQEQPS